MRRVIDVILILGFLFVDALFFHDVFKIGETTSVAQYLTGILSLLVFWISLTSLFNGKNAPKA